MRTLQVAIVLCWVSSLANLVWATDPAFSWPWTDPRKPNPTAEILSVLDGETLIISVEDDVSKMRVVGRVRSTGYATSLPGDPPKCSNYDLHNSQEAIELSQRLLSKGYSVSMIAWRDGVPFEAMVMP